MTITMGEQPAPRLRPTFYTHKDYRCFQNYYNAHLLLMPRPRYVPRVRTLIKHWQLRDLIKTDPHNNVLYYTSEESVCTIRDPSTSGARETFARLPYVPTCYDVLPGVVVAGGVVTPAPSINPIGGPALIPAVSTSYSEGGATNTGAALAPAMPLSSTLWPSGRPPSGVFLIKTEHAQATYKLGEMINNAVTVYPTSTKSLVSYVCNNDLSLYIVDVANRGVCAQQRIVCEANTALNNVCQLPDGSLLTATGDLSLVFLLDPLQPKPKVHTLKTDYDRGFGISYNSSGRLLAAAFEDGACLLFDLRKVDSPVTQVRLTRAGHQLGAFRCCKFAPREDLLVVSEHIGRVHVLDVGRGATQVVAFPQELNDVSKEKKRAFDIYGELSFVEPLVYDPAYLEENAVEGEMEICGVDWWGTLLWVGLENGGLMQWDVNRGGVRGRPTHDIV